VLPMGPTEQIPIDGETTRRAGRGAPKIRSRRFPVKVMYLGVVSKPHDEHGFDGRILLEQVSREKTITRATKHKNFTEDVFVNESLKAGGWRQLVTEGVYVDEMKELVASTYDLDEYIACRLEFSHTKAPTTPNGKSKTVVLKDNELLEVIIAGRNGRTSNDIELFVRNQQGDKIQEDCSCDSSFMLEVMPRIATATREKFFGLPMTSPFTWSWTMLVGMGQLIALQSIHESCNNRILLSFGRYLGLQRPTCLTWASGCPFRVHS